MRKKGNHLQIGVHRLFLMLMLQRPIKVGYDAGHTCHNTMCCRHVTEQSSSANVKDRRTDAHTGTTYRFNSSETEGFMNNRYMQSYVDQNRLVNAEKIGSVELVPDNHSLPEAFGYFRSANPLDGSRVMFAGRRTDGYLFFGYRCPENGTRIWAGCRDFSEGEAREHWNNPGRYDEHEESIAFVNQIVEWGLQWTPPVPVEKPVQKVLVYDVADVEEFLGARMADMLHNWLSHNKRAGLGLTREVK